MKKLLTTFILTASLGWWAGNAHAVPMLSIDDLGDLAPATVITDEGAGDLALGMPGTITFFGVVGSFTLNVSTGQSTPPLGSPSLMELDLNSVNTSVISSGTRTLEIKFTDTGFSLPTPTSFGSFSIGGTTQGSISYSAYYDSGNVAFGTATALGSLSFSSTPFAGSGGSSFSVTNPFSLTQIVSITHGEGTKVSSFDATLATPEPTSLLLLGSGLAALGLRLRKKASKA